MVNKILFIFLFTIGFALVVTGQKKINFIIQVNEKLVVSGLTDIHLIFDSVNSVEKFSVDYIVGDLIISDELWSRIRSDSTRSFFLKFNYNTFDKNRHKVANFFVELKAFHLQQPYILLNIYDFRNKNYRRWYQWHTDKDFLAELNFPNSGVYIQRS